MSSWLYTREKTSLFVKLEKMVSHFEFLYFWTYRITYLSTANLSVRKKMQFPDCPVRYRSISDVIGMYESIMLIFSQLYEFRNYGGSVVGIKFYIKIWSRDQLHFVAVWMHRWTLPKMKGEMRLIRLLPAFGIRCSLKHNRINHLHRLNESKMVLHHFLLQ